jgi:hypothetical protein
MSRLLACVVACAALGTVTGCGASGRNAVRVAGGAREAVTTASTTTTPAASANGEQAPLCNLLTAQMATENLGPGRWVADGNSSQCSYSEPSENTSGPALYLSPEELGDNGAEVAEEAKKLEKGEEITRLEGPGTWEIVSGIGSGAQRRNLGDEIVIHFVVKGHVYNLSAEREENMSQLEATARTIAGEL